MIIFKTETIILDKYKTYGVKNNKIFLKRHLKDIIYIMGLKTFDLDISIDNIAISLSIIDVVEKTGIFPVLEKLNKLTFAKLMKIQEYNNLDSGEIPDYYQFYKYYTKDLDQDLPLDIDLINFKDSLSSLTY